MSVHTGRYNVKDYGAEGLGVADDTAAIQAANNAAKAATNGGEIEFPSGRYRTTGPIDWKLGCHLVGIGGGNIHTNLMPRIVWDGPVGGTMFEAEKVGHHWPQTSVRNLGFHGSLKAAHIFNFEDRVDFGTHFTRTYFIGSTSHAVKLNKGATNFHAYDFRADGIGGYVFYANAKEHTLSMFTLDKFTIDNHIPEGPGGKGLLWVDGEDAKNNVTNFLNISNGLIELNSDPAGSENTVILLGTNPAISNKIQHSVTLSQLRVASSTKLEYSFLSTKPETTEQIIVVGTNVHIGGKHTNQLIANVNPPGPPAGKRWPFFVYAPFDSGPPGSEHSGVWLGANVHVVGTLIDS